MNMIDKVARAIANAEGFDLQNDMTLPYSPKSRIGMVMQKACTAIEAMRDPTDAMTSAGVEAWRNHYLSPVTQWRAMIDAALAEGDG